MEEIFKFVFDNTYKKNGSKNRNGGIYEVSNFGRVRRNGIIIEPNFNGTYLKLPRGIFLHKIVAELFLPNPENKPQVDHIDTNPLNNRVDNLCWCTQSENMNNPITKEHMKKTMKNRPPMSEETKRKLSESQKGRHMSEEHKKNFLEAMKLRRGKDTWMKGKHHTEESKKLISEHNWTKNPENKDKVKENGRKISERWKTQGHPKGMLGKKQSEHTKSLMLGSRWMNNKIEIKYVHKESIEDFLNNGWTFGRKI